MEFVIEMKKFLKNTKYSKLLIGVIVALNIIFTAAVLIIFLKTGSEPSILTGSWFAFTGTELWNMCSIKKKEIENNELQDE